MIGSIRGKIILKEGGHIIVEAHGVGYKVLVSEKVWSRILVDQEIFLFIYSHIREDAFDLFGFLEMADIKLFENLISVSGVGPKTAISIFSFSSRQEIVEAVLKGDVAFFTRVPRLGKKNAQKIIIELKSKFKDSNSLDLSGVDSDTNEEVYSALKTFGFSHKEIEDALKNIDPNVASTDEKIKLVLKALGSGR
jgi:holliday junction DNA helicase RuvA